MGVHEGNLVWFKLCRPVFPAVIRAKLTDITDLAPHRKAGYVDACKAAGTVDGDWLVFADDVHAALRRDYALLGAAARPTPVAAPVASVPRTERDSAAIAPLLAVCAACERWFAADARCSLAPCHRTFEVWLFGGHCPKSKWPGDIR